MKITNNQGSQRGAEVIKKERGKARKKVIIKERKNKESKKQERKQRKQANVHNIAKNTNSSRVKRKRIGKTFSGKRKSIRQAVKLGGSSKWIRLRECVR